MQSYNSSMPVLNDILGSWWCEVKLTFGLVFPTGNVVDEPIGIFEWFAMNDGPFDVTKLTAAPDVASPVSVTSPFVWSTCKRFRNVTNSLLRLFNRCCKWTASLDDAASTRKRNKTMWKKKQKNKELIMKKKKPSQNSINEWIINWSMIQQLII